MHFGQPFHSKAHWIKIFMLTYRKYIFLERIWPNHFKSEYNFHFVSSLLNKHSNQSQTCHLADPYINVEIILHRVNQFPNFLLRNDVYLCELKDDPGIFFTSVCFAIMIA